MPSRRVPPRMPSNGSLSPRPIWGQTKEVAGSSVSYPTYEGQSLSQFWPIIVEPGFIIRPRIPQNLPSEHFIQTSAGKYGWKTVNKGFNLHTFLLNYRLRYHYSIYSSHCHGRHVSQRSCPTPDSKDSHQ